MSTAFKKSKKQHSSLEERTERKVCPEDGRRGKGRTGEASRGCGAYRMWVLISWLLGMDFSFAASVALG